MNIEQINSNNINTVNDNLNNNSDNENKNRENNKIKYVYNNIPNNKIKLKSLHEILEEYSDSNRLNKIINDNSASKMIDLFRSNEKNKKNNYNPTKLRGANKKIIVNKNTIKNRNKYSYIGEKIHNTIKEGFGIQIWEEGSKFIGYFKNDKSNGYGRFLDDYNNCLAGNFIEDKLGGFGIYSCNNGTKYVGEWKNDLQHGIGIEYWKDGSIYKGAFSKGEKNGIGEYIWADGTKYQGEWKNNYMSGYGIFSFSNNTKIYYGEWENNMMNGIGELIWKKDRRKYIGYFKNDKRNGFGIFFWKKEFKTYIGFWLNGKQNGIGKYMDLNKKHYGIWKNGQLINWFKRKEEIYKYIEPEFNHFYKFFKITSEQIENLLSNDENLTIFL